VSEEAVWVWAGLSGIALGIVGSMSGITLWIIVPVHLGVLMTLFWCADRCADRDETAPAPLPEPPAPDPAPAPPPPTGWDDDLTGLLGDDGKW
jgi:hypothetical protein